MEITEFVESGLIALIVLKYRQDAEECQRRLEFEESPGTLAKLQGELSSCKLFLDSFENNFSSSQKYSALLPPETKLPAFDKVTDKTIARLEFQRIELEKDIYFEELLQILDAEIEKKKSWLFNDAEKGRDLNYAHGWRDGLKKHDVMCKQIAAEYEYRVENNTLFPDELKLEA